MIQSQADSITQADAKGQPQDPNKAAQLHAIFKVILASVFSTKRWGTE
jgi:hypothetical protein